MKTTGSCIILAILLFLLPVTSYAAPGDQDQRIRIPKGETNLQHLGFYQVGYQSYGGEEHLKPIGWTGHFEPNTGITFVPGRSANGRDTIFMHSPWRIDPGRTWVDYQLQLPDTSPISLSFGIAMDPSRVEDSDGVTFGCFLIADGNRKQLMQQHYISAEWKDYSFDLSSYAGRNVTVRLQVEPGPDRNSAHDLAYFGRPRIVAGEKKQSTENRLESFTNRTAYRAVDDLDQTPMANQNDRGLIPTNRLDDYSNDVQEVNGNFHFSYRGDDTDITYIYRPETGTLRDFTARAGDGEELYPASGGGVVPVGSDGTVATGNILETSLNKQNNTLTVDVQYPGDGTEHDVTWTFGIRGKALTLNAQSEQPGIKELRLGRTVARRRRTYKISYMPDQITYLPAQQVFNFRMLNWKKSSASTCERTTSSYHPTTAGNRHPLSDTGYITLSPSLLEVLPNLPHPVSTYQEQLASDIVLDVWAHHDGTFSGDAKLLRRFKQRGIDHMTIIEHKWQRYGYDVKLPDHYPANPDLGGHEQMKELGRTAKELGYPMALHENYIDLYPDAPSYDEDARSLKPDGSPQLAWLNEYTGVQSFGLTASRALPYAKQNSPKINDNYNTTAAYLDVHTCVPPWHDLDHDAGEPLPAKARRGIKFNKELFRYMRETHNGPLLGEGGDPYYWAGHVDAVEAELRSRSTREHHIPDPEFGLFKINPQMVNHGMGYYSRWFENRAKLAWGQTAGSMKQIDNYRAQELAYGNAGFVNNPAVSNIQWIAREHHIMHPVQKLYGTANVERLSYHVNGSYVRPGAALVAGDRSRVRVQYDSGLTLWINFRKDPWNVKEHTLPQYGFLALGPEVEARTTRVDGNVVDYVDAEGCDYVFADARTSFRMPYRGTTLDVTPTVSNVNYTGGQEANLTYQWDVNEQIQKDYYCFVHITPSDEPGEIVMQQDHALPEPTSQWSPGSTVTDGPHTLSFPSEPAETYQVTIGLYDRDTGNRVNLNGTQAGSGKILLGTLHVQRNNANIQNVSFTPAKPDDGSDTANFTAHLNPEGTSVDFGEVRTDGSVKIEIDDRKLTVFTYPRNRSFQVTLDMNELAPDATRSDLEMIAGNPGAEKQQVSFSWESESMFTFEADEHESGRYVIRW